MKFSLPKFGCRSIVGLDIGSHSVKAVELTRKSRSHEFELTHLGIAPLPPESIVQGAFLNSSGIAEAIREAVEKAKIKTKHVAAAVSGHSVIVKKVSLPAMSREDLDEQIRWEAEQYIPFDVNEVNLDFQILDEEPGDGQMDVLLVAAKKDLIDDYVQVITEAGLQAVAIDVAAFAVENAWEGNYEHGNDDTVALVNLGAQVVNINVVSGGVPTFTRDITTAGNQFTEEIQKALSVSFNEAERLKLGARAGEESQEVVPQEVDKAMQAVSETVIGEISRSLDFFAATSAESRIGKVYLSGGSASVTGFRDAFRERTGYDAEILNPLNRMVPSSKFEPDYLEEVAPALGVSVGLAMRRAVA
ncbi:MAG TPA: type IV pilus assembly protein PilM [Myxococcota bacterium]|nr:type IV pilus assembly protein PilM [Myxococcota bacterium]